VENLALGHVLNAGVYTTGEMKEDTTSAFGVKNLVADIRVEGRKRTQFHNLATA